MKNRQTSILSSDIEAGETKSCSEWDERHPIWSNGVRHCRDHMLILIADRIEVLKAARVCLFVLRIWYTYMQHDKMMTHTITTTYIEEAQCSTCKHVIWVCAAHFAIAEGWCLMYRKLSS
jgi:hypothetical protein